MNIPEYSRFFNLSTDVPENLKKKKSTITTCTYGTTFNGIGSSSSDIQGN